MQEKQDKTKKLSLFGYELNIGAEALCFVRVESDYCMDKITKMRKQINTKSTDYTIKPIRVRDNLMLPPNIVELAYSEESIAGFEFNQLTKKEYKKVIAKIKKAIKKDSQIRLRKDKEIDEFVQQRINLLEKKLKI